MAKQRISKDIHANSVLEIGRTLSCQENWPDIMSQIEPHQLLRCFDCNNEFPPDSLLWKCNNCDGVLDVRGTGIFPQDQLAQRPRNFWRYRESLGLPKNALPVSLGEVMTPILQTCFRGWNISLKLEYLLPSGSYKDRGIAVCISHLSSLGIRTIAEDSSGNAGASTAAYSAAAGIQSVIYVPQDTSPAKVNQIGIYGAKCELVSGTRVQSAQRAQQAHGKSHYIGHSWNPYFACGVKSIAYEIAEQCEWSPPDWVVTPVGGVSLVMGLLDGFDDLLAAGYIQTLPKLLAVQSAACAPIYQAWRMGKSWTEPLQPGPTLAEGVALPSPARGSQILDAIYRHSGVVIAVDEQEIRSCWRDTARIGILMEPTSSVAVAGAWKAKVAGHITSRDHVLVIITGHGLKTSPKLIESSPAPRL